VKLPKCLWELTEAPLWVALDPDGVPRRVPDFQRAVPTECDDLRPRQEVLDAIRRMEQFNSTPRRVYRSEYTSFGGVNFPT
jgi:hypothetical protein